MFDTIIITAASEAQARGYRAQTRDFGNTVCIPDPGDRRVGSLGATVNALKAIKYNPASGKKILVCHSGGDARRTPGFAAAGKAFIPMRDSRPLFEHIVESMARLPVPAGGGVVVVSGDVLPSFDFEKADLSRPGVTGVAYEDGPDEARRHGVYDVSLRKNRAGKTLPVSGFRQKPDVGPGAYLIDTGILFIDPPTAAKMKTLPVSGDIYTEFPSMLLDGFAPFNVHVARECTFFHVGSSRELLSKLGDGGVYVRNVHARLSLAGDNIVTNVPPGRFGKIVLAKGECLTCIPYGKRKWFDLRYRIGDNFKEDGLWEKHALGAIMPQVDYKRLLALADRVETKATAPVRIDLAGGWSDTPPVCNNEGGCVVNVAVRLDGVKPISVTVRERRDKFVRIVSRDLGRRRILKSAQELADRHDPSDWCALAKCALAVTGFKFGSRGLDIEMCANLPKGSGMGTSSILGATTIAALLGRADSAEIGELTLRLEAEMRTGGGWQDQFGGMLPGAKILESKPGTPQRIAAKRLDCEWLAKLFAERGLLFFTGQKRMARNILRKVLAFYAENPHGFASILIDSLKDGARKCAKAIENRDADSFAAAVEGYWRDKKLLDPGSTNERVESMIEAIRPHVSAVTLTGAGGGGFMFILAKSRADAKKARSILEAGAPSRAAKFYTFSVDYDGLEVVKVRETTR